MDKRIDKTLKLQLNISMLQVQNTLNHYNNDLKNENS